MIPKYDICKECPICSNTHSENITCCDECYGSGMVHTLLPSGHAELFCIKCDGLGTIEIEDEPQSKVDICTCGAEKANSPRHSTWCDKESTEL